MKQIHVNSGTPANFGPQTETILESTLWNVMYYEVATQRHNRSRNFPFQ